MNMEGIDEGPLDYEEEDELNESLQNGYRDHLLLERECQDTKNSQMHNTTFREYLLKSEILKAVTSAGFEHPSAVQAECIPAVLTGKDVLCQAKSGMGKTAVFVLTTLHLLDFQTDDVCALIMCTTRELAFQISKEYERFSKFMPKVRISVFFGGLPIEKDSHALKSIRPQIVVGTPGRIKALVNNGSLNLKFLKFFILDECDKLVDQADFSRDIQDIFRKSSKDKQVMMFSATLSYNMRPRCKKFMQNPLEIYVNDDQKLSLDGLIQHYVQVDEKKKNRKLFELMDALEYNQVIIFVNSVQRCTALADLLDENEFPASAIYRGMPQEERLKCYQNFKDFETRILVSTDLFGRGIDVEKVNIVLNFDMPGDSDTYLHRVGRAGRFGTKGLAITFISDEVESRVLNEVQDRFNKPITKLPDEIEISSYLPETFRPVYPKL